MSAVEIGPPGFFVTLTQQVLRKFIWKGQILFHDEAVSHLDLKAEAYAIFKGEVRG